MRLLPREHGVTVIWLSALILALTTLPILPPLQLVTAFLTASLIILIALGWLTSSSPTLMRIERSRVLPITSGGLTVISPLGYFIMVGRITPEIISIWLLFLTYTVVSVAYTQETVRSLLQCRAPTLTRYVLSGFTAFIFEATLLSKLGPLNPSALAALTPLLTVWFLMRHSPRPEGSKVKTIRRIGIIQTVNMLAFAAIISVALRL